MEQNIFLQEYSKLFTIIYASQKNTLNILVVLFGLIRGNLMECQKNILKI